MKPQPIFQQLSRLPPVTDYLTSSEQAGELGKKKEKMTAKRVGLDEAEFLEICKRNQIWDETYEDMDELGWI